MEYKIPDCTGLCDLQSCNNSGCTKWRELRKSVHPEKKLKCEVWNDSMQNWKSKPIQKAQLIIADVPYNVGTNFYGSNPVWYKGGGQQKRREQTCR